MSRAFAVCMAVIMCFTMTTTIGFADDSWGKPKESKNILVFGDSMSTGYGLPDFIGNNQMFDINNNDLEHWSVSDAASSGRARISEESYPWKMKKYIAKEEFNNDLSKVNLSSMCLAGMRTDELRALLDEKYGMAVYQKELEKTRGEFTGSEWDDIGFLTEHMRIYTTGLGGGGAKVDGVPVWSGGESFQPGSDAYKRAVAYTRGEVAKADVIITDVCLNNFGTYLGERFSGFMGIKGYETKKNYNKLTIDDIDGVSDRTWSALKVMKRDLREMGYIPGNETMDEFVDALLYGYADCVTNISANIEMMKEINPNAKLIVVGIYNTADGFSMTLSGQKLDFGAIAGYMYDSVNTYIRALDKNSPNIYYAEPSEHLRLLLDDMAEAENYEEVDETLMDQMVEAFLGMFGGDIALTDEVDAKIRTMLVDAAHQTDVNMDELLDTFAGLGQEGNPLTEDIAAYLSDETGEYQLRDSTLAAMQLAERFLFNHGLGTHPSVSGCEQKFQDIKAAYEKDYTAFEEVFSEYYPYLIGIGLKIKEAYDNGDIDKMIRLAGKMDEISAMLDVIDESGLTADELREYVQVKNELQARAGEILDYLGLTMDDVKAMLDENATPEQIASYIEKFQQIKEALDLMEEAGLTAEQLKEAVQLKKDLEARLNETLDALGLTMDDVMAALDENASPEKITEYLEKYEQISAVFEMIDEEGLTVDQLKELLQIKKEMETRVNAALELLGISMDDVLAAIDENTTPEKLAEYAAQIQKMKEVIDRLPKSQEELQATLQAELSKQLEYLWAVVQGRAAEISEDLAAQIQAIGEMLKEAAEKDDYQAIIDQLMPIGEQLLVIGEAVYELPEYEAALDAYRETAAAAQAGLEDRVAALEQQMGKLTAKAIDVPVTSKVTFPKGSVSVTLSWPIDDDAAGYILTKDGLEMAFTETETGMVFEDPDVKIGETSKYEVIPYIFWGDDNAIIYGKTFKVSVTPKVKLAKAGLKKVKAGQKSFTAKWKAVKNADGYQLSYKTGKKTKKVNVRGAKKLSKKVKKLKSKATYTVKVRAYKKVDGKTYYGAWSKTKKVKIK